MDERERIQTKGERPQRKNKQQVEGATEGVGKTIRRMVRGKNNRQQEGQKDGRETEIADRQERSEGEKPEGFRRRIKGRP